MTTKITYAIIEIFAVFLVGWLARHFRYLDEKDVNRFSAFAIDFLYPLLVFQAIIGGFLADRMAELWPLPFLGLGQIVVGALCGALLRRGMKSPDVDERRTFLHLCAINNYGFLPIIIIQGLWGNEGLARLFFFNVGSNVGYWTIGVGVLGGADIRKAARNIMSPALVALVLALIVCFCGLKSYVPSVVLRAAGSAGSAAVPMMLVLVGASLYPLPRIRDKWDIAYITFLRLALLPAVLIGIQLGLSLSRGVLGVVLVVALMPASVTSTIITRRFGGSPDFAAKTAIVTTLASIATIPLGMWLLQGFMPAVK